MIYTSSTDYLRAAGEGNLHTNQIMAYLTDFLRESGMQLTVEGAGTLKKHIRDYVEKQEETPPPKDDQLICETGALNILQSMGVLYQPSQNNNWKIAQASDESSLEQKINRLVDWVRSRDDFPYRQASNEQEALAQLTHLSTEMC